MPRFGLQGVGPIDYRSSLPQHDPNNAIWPRISAFAKMLHDISWEDDKEEKVPDQDELDAIAATEAEEMRDYSPESEKASKQMEGYKPNTPEQDREAMVDEQQRRVNGNYTGGHRGPVDMDRQRQLAEIAMEENPDTVARHQSELLDELADVNANAKTRTPSEDGNGYYQMGPEYVKHYQEIVGTPADGDWGKASKKALENYLKQRGY